MANYMHPGVYIEEVNRLGFHPVDRVPTHRSSRVASPDFPLLPEQSVAAFLGYARRGPINEPHLLTGWSQFGQVFGQGFDDDPDDGYLANAVNGFFLNGGRTCYVVRVGGQPGNASYSDLIGDVSERTGLGGLETIDEISTVCMPDLAAALQLGAIDLDGYSAVQVALLAHCEMMGNRMAILDPPSDLSPAQVRQWRGDVARYDSAFAALYYPWIMCYSPTAGRHLVAPPSGHIAGAWARADAVRGFHRAPANEALNGAVNLAVHLTRGELDVLSPYGINALISAPGRGPVIWGARTLSSDPARRLVRTRRLLNVLSDAIWRALQWVVFERADQRGLWRRISEQLRELLFLFWRAGTLDGEVPEEAFYVKCDEETNPLESVDAGLVIAEVGTLVGPVATATLRAVCLCE